MCRCLPGACKILEDYKKKNLFEIHSSREDQQLEARSDMSDVLYQLKEDVCVQCTCTLMSLIHYSHNVTLKISISLNSVPSVMHFICVLLEVHVQIST